jgi:hypothetical protein
VLRQEFERQCLRQSSASFIHSSIYIHMRWPFRRVWRRTTQRFDRRQAGADHAGGTGATAGLVLVLVVTVYICFVTTLNHSVS